jgi:glycine/serine hydroxymethyltransferase
MTTRGIREVDAEKIGDFIDRALKNADNEEYLKSLREEVRVFCGKFPVVRVSRKNEL